MQSSGHTHWGGLVEDGVKARAGGGCEQFFSSVETADRSSERYTALVYVTSTSGTTGGETKHNNVHI